MISLFRTMASEYGGTIPYSPLRHAVLAFSASLLHNTHFQFEDQMEYHKGQACRLLNRTLETPFTLNDADIIAALVLGQMAAIKDRSWCEREGLKHFQGCLAMLEYLMRSPKPPSNILTVFGPFAISSAELHCAAAALRTCQPHVRRFPEASFEQRIRWLNVLASNGVNMWAPLLIEGVLDLLSECLYLLGRCVHRAALGEMANEPQRDSLVNGVVQSVLRYISDSDFQNAIKELTEGNYEISRAQMAEWGFGFLRCVHLALTVLNAPSVCQGFRSQEAAVNAKALVSTFRWVPRDILLDVYFCTLLSNCHHAGGIDTPKRGHRRL